MSGVEQAVRSWMTRRAGESVRAHRFRVSHSCYRCGHFEQDLVELDKHEDRRLCPLRP